MTNRSLAQPRTPNTRESRALQLFQERRHEIEHIAPNLYSVPSQDGSRSYRVDYQHETCTCPDHQFRGENCVHILVIGVYRAKRRAALSRQIRLLEERYDHELMDAEERCELLSEVLRLRRRRAGL